MILRVRAAAAAVAVLGLASGLVQAGAPAVGQEAGVPDIRSVSAIVVNITDGSQVLFTRSARLKRSPASLTKVVTALVARDEYDLDEVVTTSRLVLQVHGSSLGLAPGMEISVRDLLYALLLKSGNDAGMALAAHHPAGYEHFIALMNEKARSLGAYDSNFRNPHGLDMDGHYSSARDMAIFTRELLTDPVLAAMADSEEHTMTWQGRSRTYGHHHKLVRSHPEVIGVKTGFTNRAGHCLISAATSPAGVLVTVVMGSPDHYGETLALFAYGREVSARSGVGGGPATGFGALPEPPSAPGGDPVAMAVVDNDPRDDARWLLLLITLALATAAMLVLDRSRPAPRSIVGSWLSRIASEGARG